MIPAIWTDGKRELKGEYRYVWSSDCFVIHLDSVDRITGQTRSFITHNDTPEWGKWKLKKKDEVPSS